MGSLRRHHPPPAAAAPLDDENLLSEILLRLAPQPSSLPCASAVCRRWHLLVSDRGFSRRFLLHHRRNPPLLGIFNKGLHDLSLVPTVEAPNRFPPGSFSLRFDHDHHFVPLGCRHGLVLVLLIHASWTQILVWDPITADQHRILLPPGVLTHARNPVINGAVLRAAGDDYFQVVLVVADNSDRKHRRAVACVYSSKTSVWGELISTLLPSDVRITTSYVFCKSKPAVLAGNSLYWMLDGNFAGILEFDMEKESLAVIQVPAHMLGQGHCLFGIMRAEGGGLGLLFQTNCGFQLWKRKTDCDGGVFSWVHGRTIEPEKLPFLNSEEKGTTILGFAEENNVVFLWTGGVVFMIHLDSLQFKKTYHLSCYQPFESVYTADAGIGGGHDGAKLLRNA